MPIVYLAFMADNAEQIIFIKDLGTNITAFRRFVTRHEKNIFSTHEDAEAEGPWLLCIPMVVYNAILREAGNRTGTSIFRAEDLSFVLCSNLWGKDWTLGVFRVQDSITYLELKA